jgi:glycosyltransferase involved in cell wall biosynthesis
LVLYYHNITPPEFMKGINRRVQVELERGRAALAGLRTIPYLLAGSQYNADELAQLGFGSATVIPYFMELDHLRGEIRSPEGHAVLERFGANNGGDCRVNLLFVGRLAPNKRQDDVVRLFTYYQRLVNPASRLLLVGSDVNGELYRTQLEYMIEANQLNNVYLSGRVTQDELAAYYRVASIFVGMSEHEGFCVPIIEAMALGIPVLAYAAAAVPGTMGGTGVLAHHKRYEVLAEVVDLLAKDGALRHRIIARQYERARVFSPDSVKDQLREFIQRVTAD